MLFSFDSIHHLHEQEDSHLSFLALKEKREGMTSETKVDYSESLRLKVQLSHTYYIPGSRNAFVIFVTVWLHPYFWSLLKKKNNKLIKHDNKVKSKQR